MPKKPPRVEPTTLDQSERDLWQESRIKDLWRIFRIMGEFVDGFEVMSRMGPCASIFGSARTKPENPVYEMGVKAAKRLVHHGFGVITGGGPGVMEAANRGAREAGGHSIGLNIVIPHEQAANQFVDPDKVINFDFFFVRKVMFVKYAQGFIVLPGGFGTLDELFEAVTLIQTKKADLFPIVLVGEAFWGGLVEWIKATLLEAGNISEKDLDLIQLVDDPEEAADILADFYRRHTMAPNF